MKKLHLMILGHAPLPVDHPNFGTVRRHPGRWVVDQAKAIAKFSNYRVTLVTLVKGASCDFEYTSEGVHFVYLKAQAKLRERTGFLWDVARLRKKIRIEAPDLVHAHGTEDAYALAVQGVVVPKFLTIQNLYWDINRQVGASRFSPPWVIERLEAFALSHYDQAIVKSNCFGSIVSERFPNIDLSVVPNTASETFLSLEKEIKIPNKIAFVGSILPRKGFQFIRQALEGLGPDPKFELHVFGDSGETEFVDNEVKKVLDAGHHVVLHGKVEATMLALHLATTNVLIAPSLMEPYGNQLIEGMLARCYCIVTENTGMAENVVKYGHGSVVKQRDSTAIGDALSKAYWNVLDLKEIESRDKARMRAVEDVSASAVAGKLESLYRAKCPSGAQNGASVS